MRADVQRHRAVLTPMAGGPVGVTGFDSSDGAERSPELNTACTENVYVTPLVRPTTVCDVAVESKRMRGSEVAPAWGVTR